jgi:hypothetical protein
MFDLRHRHDVEHLAAEQVPVLPPADQEGNVAGEPEKGGES